MSKTESIFVACPSFPLVIVFFPTHSNISVCNFIPLCVKTFQSCFNRGPDVIPQFSRQTKNEQQRQQKMTLGVG